MDFYITVDPEIYEEVKNLDSSLGMWFWNIAVMIAPYDTGNLRSSITLATNTSKLITIKYNLSKANYAKFLEMGLGPVKKHKGYISVTTRLSIVEQLISYLKTGRKPLFTGTPYVTLRSSENVFPREKSFLRKANMGVNIIDAKARGTISKIREAQYRKVNNLKKQRMTGLRVQTNKTRAIRGQSMLNQLYREARG